MTDKEVRKNTVMGKDGVQYRLVITDEYYRGQTTYYYRSIEEVQAAVRQLEMVFARPVDVQVLAANWRELKREEYRERTNG